MPIQRAAGVVQARMASTRLPGKALEVIGGDPMVLRVLRRLGEATSIERVGLTTTTDFSDVPLVNLCNKNNILVSRGPVDDIIGRLMSAADLLEADILIRVWGDCPFIDPAIVDIAVSHLQHNNLDYVSNCSISDRTYPVGFDVEVYKFSLLCQLNRDVVDPLQRQFPIEYIRNHSDDIAIGAIHLDEDLSKLHFTVDYPEDLEAARALHKTLVQKRYRSDLISILKVRDELPDAIMFADAPRNIEYRRALDY